MRKVWKYTIRLPHATLRIPLPAELLAVGPTQNPEEINIWVLVNPEGEEIVRHFIVVGTGHPVPERGSYVGTCVTDVGLVWHVFERFA